MNLSISGAKGLSLMNNSKIVGVCILAGGLARRMGGLDKPLVEISGKTMLAHILSTIQPRTKGPIILNANGDLARYADYKLPIVPDIVPNFAGPLAGILTGLDWMNRYDPKPDFMLSLPGDAPLIPPNLIERLATTAETEQAEIVSVTSNNRTHPVIALWSLNLLEALRHAVINEGIRKIDLWTETKKLLYVDWDISPYDPFYNINRTEDLAYAASILGEKS